MKQELELSVTLHIGQQVGNKLGLNLAKLNYDAVGLVSAVWFRLQMDFFLFVYLLIYRLTGKHRIEQMNSI